MITRRQKEEIYLLVVDLTVSVPLAVPCISVLVATHLSFTAPFTFKLGQVDCRTVVAVFNH